MPLISIVVPCYNEQESLPIFLKELDCVACSMAKIDSNISFEAILIDDGSKDATLSVMKEEAAAMHPYAIRWYSFSRNFGKEAGLFAGLQHAKGDYVATMDADMQDPPSLLPQMYEILQTEDYDNVATRRTTRDGEPPIRSFFARMFYKIINRISNADIVDGARDFRLMKRPMVDAIVSMGEYNRFSKGIYGWVGFKTKWLPYVNINRVAGETKWSFLTLLLYSIDGIVAFSTAPLSIAALTGIVFCLIAIVGFVVILVKTLVWGDPVDGWPSLACLITLFGGMQLLCLGIIGEYLAKAYLETKRRPIYIIRESNEESDDTVYQLHVQECSLLRCLFCVFRRAVCCPRRSGAHLPLWRQFIPGRRSQIPIHRFLLVVPPCPFRRGESSLLLLPGTWHEHLGAL